jgi:hypothetical protein
MAKTMGPFRNSHAPYWFSGPQLDVPAEPPPHIVPAYSNNGPRETVTNQ